MPECRTDGCQTPVTRTGTRCPTCARRHKTILQKRRRNPPNPTHEDPRIDLDADDAESITHHIHATLHALKKLRTDIETKTQPARLGTNRNPTNVVPAANIITDVSRIEKAIQPAANLLNRWNAINNE